MLKVGSARSFGLLRPEGESQDQSPLGRDGNPFPDDHWTWNPWLTFPSRNDHSNAGRRRLPEMVQVSEPAVPPLAPDVVILDGAADPAGGHSSDRITGRPAHMPERH
jgi:hypothetical protein